METNAPYLDCLCRTCMNKDEASSHDGNPKSQQQWLSIFLIIEEYGDLRIAELLSDAVPQIVVQPNDELPKKICSECLQQLLSVNRFQKMCVQSEKEMHDLLFKEQTVMKTAMLQESIKGETEISEADSQLLKELHCSSTLQNLQQPSIQESLPKVADQTIEPEAAESSVEDDLQENAQLLEHCNDSQGEFEEFIKNEPIEDDEANSQYSDSNTMHSQISVTKDEPIEPEDHQVNDASSLHNCHLCNKSFKNRESLRTHLNNHKKKANISKEYSFACHLCSELYKDQRCLSRHLKQEHSIEPQRHTCDFCNKDFVSHTELRRHARVHTGGRPFSCPECGKAFKIKEHLTNHRLIHTKDKPYECPYCPIRFNSTSSLRTHKLRHVGAKRHECDICGKGFKIKYSLTAHKLTHNEEKPHKCDVCEKGFAQMEQLKVHILTHTGEKPYKCKYCERGFNSTCLLNRHLRSHLGKNIYRCKFCPVAFPSSAEMRLHLISHKNEDPDVRERNLKALQDEEAKLVLKISNEKSKVQSTEEPQQKELSKKEIEQPSTELDELEEFIKNEPIEDGKSNMESSDDTMHSTVYLFKDRQIEVEEQQVNETLSRYKCHLCNKSYKKSEYLKRHLNGHKMKANNSKEYCHACHLCCESYKEEWILARHLKREHSIDLQRNNCSFCNKKFINHALLVRHTRTHTGERPFSCLECGKSFNTKAHLKNHSLIHVRR